MNDIGSGTIQLLLLFAFLVVAALFLFTQQKALERVRPQNRQMAPGQVWLQLIPLFGLYWQFVVIRKISFSIRDDLNTPYDDSIFSDVPVHSDEKPTYTTGIAYAVLFCITIVLPGLLKSLASLAGIILWVIYWIQLSGYSRRLRDRVV